MITYNKTKDHICLLPPSIPGSVGDQKAMHVCIDTLRDNLIILNYEYDSWNYIDPNALYVSQFGKTDSTAYYHTKGVKKLTSILNVGLHMLWNLPRVVNAFRHSKKFYILGMDIMDGHYGHLSALHKIFLAYLAAWLGAEVSIINCSFNANPDKIVVKALKNLPKSVRIVAREPMSQARMQSFLQRPIVLAADIVFLFEANASPINELQKEIDWMENERRKGQKIIVLNIADNKNYDMERLTYCFMETIRKNDRCSFVLVPHATYDNRPNLPNETKLLQNVLEQLDAEERSRCILVKVPRNLSDLQKMLTHADFGIVGRMHLAITMLSECVPVSCVGYQNKFDGLFRDYLHLPELLLDMPRIMERGDFGEVLAKLLPEKDVQVSTIMKNLPDIKSLSAKNFAEA